MKHLFIVNPVAGKGNALRRIPEINEYFKNTGQEYEIKITEYPGHATEIARECGMKQKLRIYSVGGDGTLNEVLNGIAGSGSILGAIPGGSGNDFIRSVAGENVPSDIIGRTVEGREKLIDYAKVNDKYFLNIASLGFDAEVAYQTGHFKKLPLISGSLAYVLGILTTIAICKNNYMRLETDNGSLSGNALLAAVGNGRYYGGGILALPDAEIDDGMFDICLVEEKSRLEIFRLFPQYMKGMHASIKGVHLLRSRKASIFLEKPVPMNRDGEIIMADRAVFEMFPRSLPFIIPACVPAFSRAIPPTPRF